MKTLLKILGIITGVMVLIIFIIYLLIPKQPSVPKTINNETDIDTYFNKITKNQTPPGLNITVLKEGVTVYEKAFGYSDGPKELRTEIDTIYPWWSATKLFTSVAILQLYENGLIRLDDPLDKYLPYFLVEDENGNEQVITIRQLLNHSSGLIDIMPDGVTWVRSPDQAPINQSDFLKKDSTVNSEY